MSSDEAPPTTQTDASTLLDLFSPPPRPNGEDSPSSNKNGLLPSHDDDIDALVCSNTNKNQRRSTLKSSNHSSDAPEQDTASLVTTFYQEEPKEDTPLLEDQKIPSARYETETPKTNNRVRKIRQSIDSSLPNLTTIQETQSRFQRSITGVKTWYHQYVVHWKKPSTYIGSCIFLLYHVVFCLTMASAITRPHATVSLLGLMTKFAAMGIIFAAPIYWISLAHDIPALYPTVDLFSAPFLATIASIVDDVLYHDPTVKQEENDQIFLTTFTFLVAIAGFVSATLLVLASIFRLAQLGSYLPYPVLSGFFSAVGVLMWTLSFKVDTGRTVSTVFFSGDPVIITNALLHHVPSFMIAATMKYLGPKHPFYVTGLVLGTILVSYLLMAILGISLQDAIEEKWFWSKEDLVYHPSDGLAFADSGVGFTRWAPPAPFGWIRSLLKGQVHWGAVRKGMETSIALGFLYMIRCTLHVAALKKNVPQLCRVERQPMPSSPRDRRGLSVALPHRRKFSEVVDIESIQAVFKDGDDKVIEEKIVRPNPANLSLKEIFLHYGLSQYLCGLLGTPPITPSVAASPTMYTLEAEHVAPQIGSVLLLSIFYLTDFKLVGFIPKPAFSSLLLLAFIDMIWTWFIKSYFKTKEKAEWLVVPFIVISAFTVGLLGAVFIGIALSTFIFVGTFFRSGVVKYVANGITIRSTIERPIKTSEWLDRNGDMIQILVLQNYLFFGNASSILSYITSMFEDAPDDIDPVFLPPIPKVVIIDLTLVTGMDTSAVDVFSDIMTICGVHDCKLFLAGVSTNLRKVMYLCGVKPETTSIRSKRKLRFFPNLDMATGKAEDLLLDDESLEQQIYFTTCKEKGFELALRFIDEQHEMNLSSELLPLKEYTTPIEMESSEILYEDKELERGLFFIEQGIMKIERNANFTLSRSSSSSTLHRLSLLHGSLNSVKARTGTIGKAMAKVKANGIPDSNDATFRVARVGPGWVLGSIEALSGMIHPGSMIAVTHCKLHYISYKTIQEIEEANPKLILKLQRLLAFLMAKRQSVTINQLATLHSIMSSPAQTKPIGRGRFLSSTNNSVT